MRRQKRFETRARAARLRHAASVEDVDYRSARGLDRNLFLKLATCEWIRDRQGLLLTGPAGVGKSWLACALGQKACREDLSVAYHRAPRLFAELAVARGERRYARMLQALARVELLIIDDWGPEKLQDDQRRDLLEILEDRYKRRSTPWCPARCRWIAGTKSPAIPPSLTPCSTAWCTTPTASNSRARASESAAPRKPRPQPLDPRPLSPETSPRPRRPRPPGRLQIGRVAGLKSERRSPSSRKAWPASDRISWPASSESAAMFERQAGH